MQEASRNAITPKGFDLEATRIARLMRDQVRVGFVDVGGWDTTSARAVPRARSRNASAT